MSWWGEQTSALLAATGELVELPVGQAEAFRRRIRQGHQYLCPACREPFAYARGGSRRDHFVHRPGEVVQREWHAMTAAHIDAQVRLRDWARRLGLSADLEVVDGQRRADVLVTFAEGAKVAFEVQYSGLTVADWQARHRDYRAQGTTDVWLWLLRPNAIRSRPDPARLFPQLLTRMSAPQRAAVAAGLPALWMLLPHGCVATGYHGVSLDEADQRRPGWQRTALRRGLGLQHPAEGRDAKVWFASLLDCTLTPAGLQTPMLRRIDQERVVLEELEELVASGLAPSGRVDRALLRRPQRRPPAVARRNVAWLAQRRHGPNAVRVARALAAARAQVQQRMPAPLFAELVSWDAADAGIRSSAANLRCWLYVFIRRELAAGRLLTVPRLEATCCWELRAVESLKPQVTRVIRALLDRLEANGIIHRGPSGRGDLQVIRRGARFDRWEPNGAG